MLEAEAAASAKVRGREAVWGLGASFRAFPGLERGPGRPSLPSMGTKVRRTCHFPKGTWLEGTELRVESSSFLRAGSRAAKRRHCPTGPPWAVRFPGVSPNFGSRTRKWVLLSPCCLQMRFRGAQGPTQSHTASSRESEFNPQLFRLQGPRAVKPVTLLGFSALVPAPILPSTTTYCTPTPCPALRRRPNLFSFPP